MSRSDTYEFNKKYKLKNLEGKLMSIKSGLEELNITGENAVKIEKLLRKYGYISGRLYKTKIKHLEKLIELLDELNEGAENPMVMINCKEDKRIRDLFKKGDFEFLNNRDKLIKEFNPASYSRY